VTSEIAKPKIRMNLTNPERLLQSTTLTAQARFGATVREQVNFSSLGVGRLRNHQSLLGQTNLYAQRLTRSQDLTRSFASLTKPERLLQSTTLTAQARFGARMRERIDFSSFGAGRLLREQLQLYRASGFAPRLNTDRIFRVTELFRRMNIVERQLLEGDPSLGRLVTLLRHVGVGRALKLMELMVAQGREPFLEILGEVLLDPSRVDAFRVVVLAAGLSESVEGDLLHAFEHLEEGDVDRAFHPLIGGLEGALRDAARARGDQRRYPNARSIAAILFDTDYELLIGMIYSEANDGRHGVPLNRYAACVLALVGLVVWMNDCQQRPAIQWLGQEVDRSLANRHLVVAQLA
jgi:hypothetical protein